MNNVNNENNAAAGVSREAMMQRLQEIGLTLADLTEYLDTHVNDTFAVEQHCAAAEEYQQLLERFEQLFGPLSLGGQCDTAKWLWALQDFPWDNGV